MMSKKTTGVSQFFFRKAGSFLERGASPTAGTVNASLNIQQRGSVASSSTRNSMAEVQESNSEVDRSYDLAEDGKVSPIDSLKRKSAESPLNSNSAMRVVEDVDIIISRLRINQKMDYLSIGEQLRPILSSRKSRSPISSGSGGSSITIDDDSAVEEEEEVLFSDLVKKFNRYDISQERVLVVTNRAIYNFVKDRYRDVKRKIRLIDVRALVFSSASDEVVIQVKSDYDYRYAFSHRAEFCETVCRLYETLAADNAHLPVYLSDVPLLKEFTMSKSEFDSLDAETKARKFNLVDHLDPNAFKLGVKKSKVPHRRDSEPEIGSIELVPKKIVANNLFRTTRQGWLTKQKDKGKSWSLKYFILTSTKLAYFDPRMKGSIKTTEIEFDFYESSTANDSKAHLRIPSDSYIASPNQRTRHSIFAQQPDYQFIVKSKSRSKPLRLGCNAKTEAEQWKEAFQISSTSQKGDQSVYYEGWILKQDPHKSTWKSRFLIIRAQRFWYFDMDLRWVMMLDQGTISARPSNRVEPTLVTEDPDLSVKTITGYPYRFTVSDAKTIYNLAAESETEMFSWIQDIQKACMQSSTAEADESWFQFSDLAAVMKPPEGFVTIVFTDIQSSTKLWESMTDAMNEALELHDTILRDLLKIFKGYEVKTEGDAFMVAFLSPIDAVLWCLNVQMALTEADWPPDILLHTAGRVEYDSKSQVVFKGLRVRMGINCGYPNCRRNPVTNRMDYFGPDVNLASRIANCAHGGQVTATQEVVDALEESQSASKWNEDHPGQPFPIIKECEGKYLFKGIRQPVRAFQLFNPKLEARSDLFPPLRAPKATPQYLENDDIENVAPDLGSTESLPTYNDEKGDSESDKDELGETTRVPLEFAGPALRAPLI